MPVSRQMPPGVVYPYLMLEALILACATSSASSKLIHGGLRYLEHYEFRLVSEALAEREVLLKWPRISPSRCAFAYRIARICARHG